MQFLEKNENVFQESQHSAAFFSQLSLENVHCGESILPIYLLQPLLFLSIETSTHSTGVIILLVTAVIKVDAMLVKKLHQAIEHCLCLVALVWHKCYVSFNRCHVLLKWNVRVS